MTSLQLQKLSRENRKLQQSHKALSRQLARLQSSTAIYHIIDQCLMHRQLSKKHMKQKQYLSQQIKELRRREQQRRYEKEQTQNRYMNVLRKLQEELEQRKIKYSKLQNKISPLLDHDSVRLRILNEVQSVHFMQVEQHRRKANDYKDQILKLKRENELCKHQLENVRIEHEDEVRRIRSYIDDSSRNDHLNQISYELCMDVENKLRINYEQARKECDYYKDKYFSCERRYQERIGNMEKELMEVKLKLGTA